MSRQIHLALVIARDDDEYAVVQTAIIKVPALLVIANLGCFSAAQKADEAVPGMRLRSFPARVCPWDRGKVPTTPGDRSGSHRGLSPSPTLLLELLTPRGG